MIDMDRPLETVSFETPALDESGVVVVWTPHTVRCFIEDLGAGVGLPMVLIEGGMFQMGSPPHRGYDDEHPLHWVRLAPFAMARQLITQDQWRAVTGKLPPCRFKGDALPVERVSWEQAQDFCRQLSAKTGRRHQLPSEAQWEYACRAGTNTAFSFGETLTTDIANYVGEPAFRQEPRGQNRHCTTVGGIFPSNAFGLYDMHGNLWEYCADNWLDDYTAASHDEAPHLSEGDVYRVARGGSWHEQAGNCRSATRLRVLQSDADEVMGFRVCVV
jgi:formylglycine-generating enzyme required for sulfatase activity